MHDAGWRDEMLRCFYALATRFCEHLTPERQWLNDHAPQGHTLHRSNPASVQVEIGLLRNELAGDEPFTALLKIRDWLVDHIRSDERMRPLIAAPADGV